MSLTDSDIESLINLKRETPNVDYKESLIWSKDNKDGCLSIIKDILAMSNTKDGGKLIIGVKDADYSLVNLSDESFSSFDTTKVNELLREHADPTFHCSVYKTIINGCRIVIIDVPEFDEVQ
jgi:predicted HTH transcriptional regulator